MIRPPMSARSPGPEPGLVPTGITGPVLPAPLTRVRASSLGSSTSYPVFQFSVISLARSDNPEQVASSAFVEEDDFPEGTANGWLTVLGAFMIVLGTFGTIAATGLLQAHLETHQLKAFSPEKVGWISGTNIFLALLLPVQIGPLFDRFGSKWILVVGGLLHLSGLLGMSFLGGDESFISSSSTTSQTPDLSLTSRGDHEIGRAIDIQLTRVKDNNTYALLLLTWGVLCGSGTATLCTAATGCVTHWFKKKRGLACGIAFMGASVGGVIFPLVMRETLGRYGWAHSTGLVAALSAGLVISGTLAVKTRLPRRTGAGGIDVRCFGQGSFCWTTLALACESLSFVPSTDHNVMPRE
jgi:MFS family permease